MMMLELQSFPKFIPSEIPGPPPKSIDYFALIFPPITFIVESQLLLNFDIILFFSISSTPLTQYNMADNSAEETVSYEDLALIEEQFEEVDVEIRMHSSARYI
jgi:hypothetical protein